MLSLHIVERLIILLIGPQSILSALEGVDSGDETVVTSSLVHLTEVVNNMQKTLSRMHGKLPRHEILLMTTNFIVRSLVSLLRWRKMCYDNIIDFRIFAVYMS